MFALLKSMPQFITTKAGRKVNVEKGNLVFKDISGQEHQADPTSIVTQTITGDPDKISKPEFEAFLKKHNLLTEKIEKEENQFRARQVDPDKFKDESFRTFQTPELPPGVNRVGGRLLRS